MDDNIVYKKCSKCKKDKSMTEFINDYGKPAATCDHCRAKDKERNNDADRIAYKKKYNAENPEINIQANILYRKENANTPVYKERAKINAQKHRDNNPKKMQKIYADKKLDKDAKLKTCKDTAESKNNTWELTDEYAFELFSSNCYYCNYISDTTLTGIDRVDNFGHYTVDNVKPCCQDCNFMKNTLDISTFIKRCIHIATYNEMYHGMLYPASFNDIKKVSYSSYVERAAKKELVFDEKSITKEVFNSIISKDCYICGKKSNDTHKNGLDRFDNNTGYTLDNVRSCCNNCNIMKSTHPYMVFLDKCDRIAEFCKLENIDVINKPIIKQLTPTGNIKPKLNRAAQRELDRQAARDKKQEPGYVEARVKGVLELRRLKELTDNKPKAIITDNKPKTIITDNKPKTIITDNKPKAVVNKRSNITLFK